jgi:iron complex transport system permease protein
MIVSISTAVRTKAIYSRLFTGLVLIALVLFASQWGAVHISFADWVSLINQNDDIQSGSSYVLWQLRLPRAIFATLIGAALGLSGALTQGLFRNPLADPGLLGVSAGAACAVSLGVVVLNDLNIPILSQWRFWTIPALAFSGAILVCFAFDQIARWITPGSIAGLLLMGIALNALAAAIIGLCTYLATDE